MISFLNFIGLNYINPQSVFSILIIDYNDNSYDNTNAITTTIFYILFNISLNKLGFLELIIEI